VLALSCTRWRASFWMCWQLATVTRPGFSPKFWRCAARFRFSSARSNGFAGVQAIGWFLQRYVNGSRGSAWAGLLVKPETVLGWHRALVRGKWAAYHGRPQRGRPPTSAVWGLGD
jgi:hypothetical protein